MNYKELEKLIAPMELPSYRKKVVNKDDLRWLSKSIHIRNAGHKNYAKAKELLEKLL